MGHSISGHELKDFPNLLMCISAKLLANRQRCTQTEPIPMQTLPGPILYLNPFAVGHLTQYCLTRLRRLIDARLLLLDAAVALVWVC